MIYLYKQIIMFENLTTMKKNVSLNRNYFNKQICFYHIVNNDSKSPEQF